MLLVVEVCVWRDVEVVGVGDVASAVKAKRQALAASGCRKLDSVFGLKR